MVLCEEPLCAACEQKEAVKEGFCPYCYRFYDELNKTGDETMTFLRAMEIADECGLLTDEMRREWLEANADEP